ncbi:alanine racemase [Xenorhabdus bovienii]|uniref:Broad specificity amino-acid racemase n=2 Tax=Xenorhabdus bovienii TaxID=40576 RepID=A0A077N8S0_XENBV|nr:alanine racemase [Xenorhabdus bovienii]MCG3461940.1 alanine racemase [Xenorhabdus bovienii]MCG3470086.1 alanine racemase [Xenorhabdus bovienii]CDG95459.1 putative alanine racemase [Xenorhabdus bovienii str. puntauvense]
MRFNKITLAILLGLTLCQGTAQAAPALSLDNTQAEHVAATNNAWVEINTTTFENNIHTLQSKLTKDTKVCVVLKGDAYGHGIDLLMPSVIKTGMPCVGITSNEEARIVRESGFKGQLMRIRAAAATEIESTLGYDMEEMVGDLEHAKTIDALAKKHGKAIRVHLVLNTGRMSRNGLEMKTEQGKQEALKIAQLPNLKLVGMMSHYALKDLDAIREGVNDFKEQTAWLIKTANLKRNEITLHASSSYASIRVPEAQFDMVRVGSALYGVLTPEYPEFKPLIQVKTRVASVKPYPKGNGVSYDNTYILKRDSKLANLPVGFSDGFSSSLSNKAFVLINGHRAPVVGLVSMNTVMVDVTDLPDVKSGDEVVIFGKQGKEEITQSDIQKWGGMHIVEFSSIWGETNPRIAITGA